MELDNHRGGAGEAAMDESGFETAHLAGNSLGGWVSLELARRGRARTVTAISPAGLASEREGAWGRGILRVMRFLAQTVSAPEAICAIRSVAPSSAARPWAGRGAPTPRT